METVALCPSNWKRFILRDLKTFKYSANKKKKRDGHISSRSPHVFSRKSRTVDADEQTARRAGEAGGVQIRAPATRTPTAPVTAQRL